MRIRYPLSMYMYPMHTRGKFRRPPITFNHGGSKPSYYHRRRCFIRRARQLGLQQIRAGFWYHPSTEVIYIITPRGLEVTDLVTKS